MKKDEKILLLGDKCYQTVFDMLVEDLEKRFTKKDDFLVDYTRVTKNLFDVEEYKSIINSTTYTLICICIGDSLDKLPYSVVLNGIKNVLKENKNQNAKIVMNTVPLMGKWKKYKKFNDEIKVLANQNKLYIADIHTFFRYYKDERPDMYEGIFNNSGVKIIVHILKSIIMHSKLLVLWQYNGRYAHCNYSCPYCYVATSVNKGMHFRFDIETWEKAFEKHFGEKDTIFYFSYGEPLMGGNLFYDILEMIGKHQKWEVRMTSNVSVKLERLLNTTLARTGRLNINASFHPSQVDIDTFIAECNQIRKSGIEPSIVYVMYPEQIDDFENKYLPKFREFGYRVHIRAFRGLYKGKKYPQAYNKSQWIKVAKYMDLGNFKYQLNAVNGLGRVSFLGVSHILVDNIGKIEMCDSYVGDRHYGNIFDDVINLDIGPQPFPGLVPLAAVDDIADYFELGYDELTGNNINSYIEQGGVRWIDGKIEYPLENIDFKNNDLIRDFLKIPKPQVKSWKFWINPGWFFKHFIYSYVIKKYGKYILAWIRGKITLIKAGKLQKGNFWHG